MFAPTAKTPQQHASPCLGAGRLLLAVLLFSLALLLATGAHRWLWAPDRSAGAERWMRQLSLCAPALWPAGSALRHPETLHPGVDLRFAAGLERSP